MNNTLNSAQSWISKLEGSGFRVTAPRKAVIDVLIASQSLLEPMDIFFQARSICPGLGLVTVYRTLEKLEWLHLVQRVHNEDGCHAYVASREGHQHLLVCTDCHKAEYFSGDDLGELMDSLGSTHGFQITDHWLQLSGICSDCKEGNQKEHENEK